MWVEYQLAISLIVLFSLGGTEGTCLVVDSGAGGLEMRSALCSSPMFSVISFLVQDKASLRIVLPSFSVLKTAAAPKYRSASCVRHVGMIRWVV